VCCHDVAGARVDAGCRERRHARCHRLLVVGLDPVCAQCGERQGRSVAAAQRCGADNTPSPLPLLCINACGCPSTRHRQPPRHSHTTATRRPAGTAFAPTPPMHVPLLLLLPVAHPPLRVGGVVADVNVGCARLERRLNHIVVAAVLKRPRRVQHQVCVCDGGLVCSRGSGAGGGGEGSCCVHVSSSNPGPAAAPIGA
jgi:hypothetical protein